MAVWWQVQGGGSPMSFLIMMGVMFALLYFVLFLPRQRQEKKWKQLLGSLKAGDKVVTTGGLRGTIFALKDDAVTLRVPPDNLKLEVTRASIVSVTTPDEDTGKPK